MAQPTNAAPHTIKPHRQRSSSMYDVSGGALGLFGATFPPPRPPKSKSRGNIKVVASPPDQNRFPTPSSSESSPKSRKPSPPPSDPVDVASPTSPIAITPFKSRNTSQVSLRNSPPNPEVERILAKPALLRTKPKGARPRSSTMYSTSPISIPTAEQNRSSATISPTAVGQSPFYLASTKPGGKSSSSSSSPVNLSPVKPSSPPQRRIVSKPSATQPFDIGKERSLNRRSGLRVVNTTPPLDEAELPSPLSPSLSDDSDSSANLSIPQFYSNPRASSSEKTMDTMSFALRSLAPAHTPTIDHLSPKILQAGGGSRRKLGSVVAAKEKKSVTASVSSSPMVTANKPGSKSRTPNASSTPVVGSQKSGGASAGSRKTAAASSKSTTPLDSPSVLGPTPIKRRTDFIVSKGGGGDDVDEDQDDDESTINRPSVPVLVPSSSSGPSFTKRKKQHGVPPPLKLAGSNFSKNGGKSTHRRSSRASSIIGTAPLSPRTPLSPALSIMSTVTIATLVGRPRRPTEKELRRRRFAKLTRTLGEDIPPELLAGSSVGKRRIEGGGSKGATQRANTIVVGSRDTKKKAIAGLDVGSRKKTTGVGSRWSGVFTGGGGGGVDGVVRDSSGSGGARLSTHFPLSAPLAGGGGDASGPASPNVLRKYGSLRRKRGMSDGSNAAVEVDAKLANFNNHRVSGSAVKTVKSEAQPPMAPYFEDHPFRMVVEEPEPTAMPTTVVAASPDPRGGTLQPDSHLQRDSVYSMVNDNPWMRASLAFPMQYDSPFIEYAAAAFAGVNVNEVNVSGSVGGGGNRTSTYLTLPPLDFVHSDPTGVHRKEKRDGWSGEWNQPHIKDVIEKLRQL
ncbi:hypothetical protein H1R20_g8385, partial [Candolleomyces eurysporus]